MHKKKNNFIKVIAKHLAIAFLYTSFIIFSFYLIFGKKIEKDITIINKIFVFNNTYNKKDKNITLNKIEKRLNEYPSIGEVIGSVTIPSIDVDITLYQGESLRILKYGLGHHTGTFFPGEGGTIIIAGHNTYGQLYNLPKIKINDRIIIKTNYGEYTYKVNKTSIEDANILGNNLKLKDDSEEVMIYTCYPVETPGYKSKRFVAWASLEGDNNA